MILFSNGSIYRKFTVTYWVIPSVHWLQCIRYGQYHIFSMPEKWNNSIKTPPPIYVQILCPIKVKRTGLQSKMFWFVCDYVILINPGNLVFGNYTGITGELIYCGEKPTYPDLLGCVLLCALMYCMCVFSSVMLAKHFHCVHTSEQCVLFYSSDVHNEHVLYYLQNHHVVQMKLH